MDKMTKNIRLFLLALMVAVSACNNGPVKIIFDNDFGGDADDLGALAMLHNLHNQGKCELLGIASWSTEKYVIPAIDGVNRFYGNPDIPMGIRSKESHYSEWNYNKAIADQLPHTRTNDDVPAAVELYRKILSGQKDRSVTIVTVGPLKNIMDLIMSGPDAHSGLTGKELIEKKVKEFVIMGGHFPKGENEWNFNGNMPGVTKYVLENLTVPVVFSGYEIGLAIKTGAIFNNTEKNHPLYTGFMHFSKHAPWMNDQFAGKILDNASYDQTAVLYSVHGGIGEYWNKVEDGYCVAEENGDNYWQTGDRYNHAYLVLKETPKELEQLIEHLMLADVSERSMSLHNDVSGLDHQDGIQPFKENPMYWQYKGKPLLLLGGSWQDNLFNHPTGLAEHLDLLLSVGGNYVRNTMSHRNQGNVFAYEKTGENLFALDRFNGAYWQRLENFLNLCVQRDIIVQLEIWDPWDHYEDHQSFGGWSHHPFNPENNLNYTPEESGLPTAINYAPRGEPTEHPFFRTVPELNHNQLILGYQQAYVDKLLSISLQFPNVLYCVNNESGELIAWSDYWADYVHAAAKKSDVTANVTEMRRNEDVRAVDHHAVYDHPERYTFVDISQNNAWSGLGQGHYDNIMYVRNYISEHPRPINNMKNYGATRHGEDESVARFCRIVFAGCASARFHRPHPIEDPSAHEASSDYGLGLSPLAQKIIQSMRWATDEIDIFSAKPRNELLADREENEAYLLADTSGKFAVYFPNDGEVTLDLTDAPQQLKLKWLHVTESRWEEDTNIQGGGEVRLKTPGNGHWVAIIGQTSN